MKAANWNVDSFSGLLRHSDILCQAAAKMVVHRPKASSRDHDDLRFAVLKAPPRSVPARTWTLRQICSSA